MSRCAVLVLIALAGCAHRAKLPKPEPAAKAGVAGADAQPKEAGVWFSEYLLKAGGAYVAEPDEGCTEWAVRLNGREGTMSKQWVTNDGGTRYEEEWKISLIAGQETISNLTVSRTYHRTGPGTPWEVLREEVGVYGCAGPSGLWERRQGSHVRIRNVDVFTTRFACEEFLRQSTFTGCVWVPRSATSQAKERSR